MTKKADKRPEMDAESRAFYDKILSEYEMNTAGKKLLEVACFTLTRWRQARAILDREGCVLPGAIARIHPAAKIENDARLSFCRFVKELNLDQNLEKMTDE
jgi:hypothetical protein